MASVLLAMPLAMPTRAAAAEPAALRMLVLASSSMPLARVNGDKVEAGLLKDLGELIARATRMPLELIVRPRNRIAEALEHGQADMYCDSLPEWLPDVRQHLYWSSPVNWNPQYLVSAAPRPAPERWEQLHGRTIITLLGYKYSKPAELARGFAEGSWQRSDATNSDVLLRRLLLGRGDYGIVAALPLNWFLKQNPRAHFNIGITVLNEPTRCALVEHPGFDPMPVLQAIKHLGDKGELQRLTHPYLPSH